MSQGGAGGEVMAKRIDGQISMREQLSPAAPQQAEPVAWPAGHRWARNMAALDSFGFTRAAETLERASTEIDRLRAEVEALRADAETKRGLLLWALYHSQGASSQVGQPIRRNLGIGRHERLTPEQIKDAERASQKSPCGECHLQPGEQCDVCGARAAQGDN